ncbi:MAG: M23 family metallopeptidase [Candidatus Beckwithbacteria bacterium]|nr:M23 family metallopeptidase [Candidatus Beckwithbacteria bacterium]
MILKRLILLCWSMLLMALMLPYQIFRVFVPATRRGRPGSHPISKFFRHTFENKKTRQVVGAGLTIILMFSGLMSNIAAANEPLKTDETVMVSPDSQIETKTSLQHPIKGVLAQGFHGLHKGIDILAPLGTEIRPINSGQVIEISFGRIGWGNTVVVEHEQGLKSRYAHMRDINVVEGQAVDKEVVLGTVGMTGWTTGPHLHLETYQYDKAIDPQSVLPEFP